MQNKPFLIIQRLMIKTSFMADKIMPLSEAVEGYDLFDKMKVQKGEDVYLR